MILNRNRKFYSDFFISTFLFDIIIRMIFKIDRQKKSQTFDWDFFI